LSAGSRRLSLFPRL